MKEPILYRILRPIITFLIKVVFHPKIIGKENIKKEGNIILAGNHTNILDCLLLIASTKRTVFFLAKDELSKGIKGILFNNMGIIPVNRKQGDPNALKEAIKHLENKQVIGIFPEGTINKTKIEPTIPFKSGAVRMAYQTNSPIIPFTIIGKYHIFGKSINIKFEKPHKIETDNTKLENEKLRNLISNLIIERRNTNGND